MLSWRIYVIENNDVFFYEFYVFRFYDQVFKPFELIFLWGVMGVLFHSSACGYAVFSSPFIENTVLDPLYILLL